MITKLNFTDRTIKSYAIRKLTPKECFRLMGVRDKVIGTMQSSNAQAAERLPDWKGKGKPEDMAVSASQQYKQAGNSIVVDVLAHIYEQLFYPTPKSRKLKQLSLFADLDDALPDLPPTSANAAEEKIFLTTFSGYDSQLMAADVLKEWHPDFRWTCVGWSDIDKYACQMHNLVFPQFADCALGDITKIDWWFLDKMQHLADLEKGLAKCNGVLSLEQYQTAKKYGFQDKTIKRLAQVDALPVENYRAGFKMVDTCAAEFSANTPYFYSTYDGDNEAAAEHIAGQLGIEELSRGAQRAVFVDRRTDAVKLIRENLALTRLEEGAQVVCGESMSYLNALRTPFDLIFLDPPYADDLLERAVAHIARFDILAPNGIMIAESPAEKELPKLCAPYRVAREYRYGRIKVTLYRRDGEETT